MTVQLFVKLVLAYLIGDFMLQPTKWVIHKEANKAASKFLYVHVLVHFMLYMLFLWDFQKWWIALILSIGHLFIDMAKLYVNPLFKNKSIPFFLDQILHILNIYVFVYFTNLHEQTMALIQGLDWPLVLAIGFVTTPSAIVMGKLLGVCPIK